MPASTTSKNYQLEQDNGDGTVNYTVEKITFRRVLNADAAGLKAMLQAEVAAETNAKDNINGGTEQFPGQNDIINNLQSFISALP